MKIKPLNKKKKTGKFYAAQSWMEDPKEKKTGRISQLAKHNRKAKKRFGGVS
jgi:hypothetical protein